MELHDQMTISASDDLALYTRRWLPQREPAGAVLIVHGMGEHGGRYGPFAEALAAAGFAVYAPDLRGHGLTAGSGERIVHFADERGWELVLNDIQTIVRHLRATHPASPLFLIGHSMGSLLVRRYIQQDGAALQGAVLSATQGDPGLWPDRPAYGVGGDQANRSSNPSKLLRKLLFGNFNRAFRPNRTPSIG